ncbi:hypothetical protein [Agrococcus sp. Ld7]|uniref:hypothetical protein n=1 Tax=Agrococcus sp. Ld7 TaxID=649148 RepID=UPI003863B2D6
MHNGSRSIVRAAAPTVVLILAIGTLAGCAPSGAPPGATTAPPTATATPMPTATVTSSPAQTPTMTPSPAPSTAPPGTPASSEPSGNVFQTQNGTMRLPVPAGWIVDDQSRLSADHSGQPWWENAIDFTSPDGTLLTYYDGFGSNVGLTRTDFGVVEERPMDVADGVAARSWWAHDSGRYFVHAAVATAASAGTEPVPEFVLPGVERNHTFTMLLLGDDQPFVGSQAEAEQLLGSAAVVAALDVMAELELTAVDPTTMPPGVEP